MDFLSKIDKQAGCFYQLQAILNRKTYQYHNYNHKPDYISLRKQENCIKRPKTEECQKKIYVPSKKWHLVGKQLSVNTSMSAMISYRTL